jgi:hypothetical protein
MKSKVWLRNILARGGYSYYNFTQFYPYYLIPFLHGHMAIHAATFDSLLLIFDSCFLSMTRSDSCLTEVPNERGRDFP